MSLNQPIQLVPLIKRAIWGGERLAQSLGKETGEFSDVAESWETADLPGNVCIVRNGPFAGKTLRQLVQDHPVELLGQHAHLKQFPILVKFLDAQSQLSVQVHPKNPVRLSDGTWRTGKAESWIVLDAQPESRMYLGLKPGITAKELRTAVQTGDFESCLHTCTPKIGDCFYLEPGTVHALGGGILVAEIQQPSDVTYRFYDWGRTDSQGRSRELHIEESFAATNFEIGAVHPVIPTPLPDRQRSERLVRSPYFEILRHPGPGTWSLPDDRKMHVLIVLSGTARQKDLLLRKGETAVIPAGRIHASWQLSDDAILLDATLPDQHSAEDN